MKKLLNRIFLCLLAAICFWCGSMLGDRQRLNEEMTRFRAAVASGSAASQENRQAVRDAAVSYLGNALSNLRDRDAAACYFRENLEKLQSFTNDTLCAAGMEELTPVSFNGSSLSDGIQNMLSFPAEIYRALWITFGSGENGNGQQSARVGEVINGTVSSAP